MTFLTVFITWIPRQDQVWRKTSHMWHPCFFAQRRNIYTSITGAFSSNFKIFRACKDQQEPSLLFVPQCYNHLQKYLQHCTVVGLNWPAHDLVLAITLLPLSKLKVIQDLSQTMEGLNEGEGGREGVSLISHICVTSNDLWLKRPFFLTDCLIIFATGFSGMQYLHYLVIKSSCNHV